MDAATLVSWATNVRLLLMMGLSNSAIEELRQAWATGSLTTDDVMDLVIALSEFVGDEINQREEINATSPSLSALHRAHSLLGNLQSDIAQVQYQDDERQ